MQLVKVVYVATLKRVLIDSFSISIKHPLLFSSDSLFAVNTEEIIKNIGNILEIELE